MDKSIPFASITIHSPRFKPWAMRDTHATQPFQRFFNLKSKVIFNHYATFLQ